MAGRADPVRVRDRLILSPERQPLRIVRDLADGSQAILNPSSGDVLERLPKGRKHHKQEHELCTLVPSEPERVRAVRRMLADFAGGKPSRTLREELNRAGFRTSRDPSFTVQTILPILENPAYVGRCVYNRRTLSKWHRYLGGSSIERPDEGVEKRDASDWIVAEGAWPALVDLETWEAVQRRRKESTEHHRHTTGRAVRANYLLRAHRGVVHLSICTMHGLPVSSSRASSAETAMGRASRRGAGLAPPPPAPMPDEPIIYS